MKKNIRKLSKGEIVFIIYMIINTIVMLYLCPLNNDITFGMLVSIFIYVMSYFIGCTVKALFNDDDI